MKPNMKHAWKSDNGRRGWLQPATCAECGLRLTSSKKSTVDTDRSVYIHRHIDRPGEWVLTIRPMGVFAEPLRIDLMVEARYRALEFVRNKMLDISKVVNAIEEANEE